LTTNAGAQSAEKNQIGFGSQSKDYTDSDLKKFFTPEFRNRLDGIITFNKLGKDVMGKVVNKFIDELKEQVKEKAIRIKADKTAIEWLIEKGFDPKMGARPLQRVIDKEIKRDLARMMLFGDLKNGGWVTITVADDKILLVAKPKVPKTPLLTTDNMLENASQDN
jgi:ATP-dependent Clp protease ATP-binding subunit ClpA